MELEILKRRIRKRQLIAAVIMTVAAISVVLLSMRGTAQTGPEVCTETVHIFMKIDGIDGETEFGGITGQIEVIRFSQGVYNTMTGAERMARTPTMQPITITKLVDKVTPKLYDKSTKGAVLPLLTLRFYRGCPDSEPFLYFQIELKNVQLLSIRSYHAGAQDSLPMEEVSLNYEEIKWTWSSEQGKIEAVWKVEAF